MTERQRFSIDDLYQLDWLEEPAISPDGRWVAFVRVTVDKVANRYRRAIWLAPTDGGRIRRLTAGTRSDTTPRWSPDSRSIAFVSNRDGDRTQIYMIDTTGGEARKLTSAEWGATSPAWSPDGRRIAFLARLNAEERAREDSDEPPPAPPADDWERQQQQARRTRAEEQRIDPRIVTKLPYRSGTTYYDDRFSHIHLVDLPDDDQCDPRQARRLTEGDLHYAAPVWSRDGLSILSSAGRDPEADTLFGYDDIVRVPVPESGRAPAIRLTMPGYSYLDPQPSPDGRWIAARRRDEGRPLARGAAIVLLPAEGGEPHDLTGASDLNIEQYRWAPQSDALLFTAAWWGEQPIYRVPIAGGVVAPAGAPSEARFVSDFDVARDGSVAFVAGTGANPCELYHWQPDQTERRLTEISERLIRERAVVPFEELSYPAPDGQTIQGWVLYPPDFDPARRYPLAIHIHGGPHLMWAPGFRAMWHELQVSAAQGYITFFCNPRGSDGYGERWRDGVHRAWGDAAPDILAGVELLLARGQIDPLRIAVAGGSYGGYMTAWLLAHEQRFACGVAARGVYDLISFHGTSDAHELIEFEFDGRPWEQRDLLWAQSPLAHAHQITTPLLILHAELDWRVPIAQAEQLFSNLRRRKIPTELVRYPREGHELTRSGEPDHRADHMRRTLAWFDRHCQPAQ